MFFTRSYSDAKIIETLVSTKMEEKHVIQYLIDENRGKIASYVMSNGGGKDDAESVLIEGVTNLILNVRNGKFNGDSTLSTYLYAICRGIWLKSLRKEKRFTDFNVDESTLIDDDSPLLAVSEEELQTEVDQLLSKIGEACRKVLKLWAQQYSMAEIANSMNYKNAQISMNKKNRCLGKLKAIVKENREYGKRLQNLLHS